MLYVHISIWIWQLETKKKSCLVWNFSVKKTGWTFFGARFQFHNSMCSIKSTTYIHTLIIIFWKFSSCATNHNEGQQNVFWDTSEYHDDNRSITFLCVHKGMGSNLSKESAFSLKERPQRTVHPFLSDTWHFLLKTCLGFVPKNEM